MKKVDFVLKTERWLVQNDVIDSEYQKSATQAAEIDINQYINSVKGMLLDKAPDLYPTFKMMIKENRVRGMQR